MLEWLWMAGMLAVEFYAQIVHFYLGLDQRMPFMPLLLISVHCSLGIIYSWFKFIYLIAIGKQ
jgi:alpha-1,3-glucosyltransferase